MRRFIPSPAGAGLRAARSRARRRGRPGGSYLPLLAQGFVQHDRELDAEGDPVAHTFPCWRRASYSTIATAVARFRLRTCSLASGMPKVASAYAFRMAGGSPRLS